MCSAGSAELSACVLLPRASTSMLPHAPYVFDHWPMGRWLSLPSHCGNIQEPL